MILRRRCQPTQLYLRASFIARPKSHFSWFARVIAQVLAIVCTSCQGLLRIENNTDLVFLELKTKFVHFDSGVTLLFEHLHSRASEI